MSAQVEFLQNATRNNAYSPLIATANATDLVRHEDQMAVPNPPDIPISEVRVRHLKTSSDIQEIQFLRDEINLELHRAIDPLFAATKKKR